MGAEISDKVLCFLGNPGSQYAKTRHNAGWMVIKSLSFATQINWMEKFKGETSLVHQNSQKLYLLKPKTYMNLSGESLQALLSFYKLTPVQTLVVHDDLELPCGRIRLQRGGGLGGHNGLKSIAQNLGTQDFYRLRLGIGRPERESVSSFVLGAFAPHEEPLLQAMLTEAARKIESDFLLLP